MTRVYPDEPAGPFESPPVEFTDGAGRDIEIRPYEDDDFESLVEMYVAFDPADRAQGIPPTGEERVQDWLETITDDGLNLIAWHGDDAVGHATLVPDEGGVGTHGYDEDADECELAIFVLQDYQEAGIGSELIHALLGYGADEGVTHVWLSVERWNRAAVSLYEKVGFETSGTESFELEMAIKLA